MNPLSTRFRFAGLARLLAIAIGLSLPAAEARSQSQLPQWLTSEEQRSIEKENGENDRLEALLKVSSARLKAARVSLGAEQYEQANNDIQNYGELAAYTSAYVQGIQKKEKDKRKLYKKMEQSLRQDLNTLGMMRYEMPQKYAEETNDVYEKVRKMRESALGAIFGKDFFPSSDSQTDNGKTEGSDPKDN